jgi:Tfp pilus assembly protein PilX
MKRPDGKLAADQRGMVSFMVTLIMILVITLIVLGFAQVARRNQREALDRQQSTQAYYAAESGVNTTADTIKAKLAANATLPTKTTCPNNYDGSSITDLSSGVSYTCVLVDPTPSSLTYSDISKSSSTIALIQTATPLTDLNFTWAKAKGAATGNCTGQQQYYLPASTAWTCGFGILRVDLVQVKSPNINSADQLAANTVTLYLTPQGAHNGKLYSAGGMLDFGASTHAYYGSGCEYTVQQLLSAGTTCPIAPVCSTSCTVTFPLTPASKQYYARITSLYNDAGTVTITGKEAGGQAKFLNSQAVVDVTGKSQDVLRRIQVRLGISNSGSNSGLPLNALTSTNGICKQFTIAPGQTDGDAADDTCL